MKLEAENLSYRASDGTRKLLVQPVNLTLEPGTVTLLIGRTGSGKSTLLHLLAGLKIPEPGGQVYYGGEKLWGRGGKPEGRLLKQIGFVYQYPEHQFFLPTVRQELLYSLRPYRLDQKASTSKILEAARVCGLQEELLERSPFWLSGGEKRKAALASAVAIDPEWLLLDEPSSGLDPAMSAWLVSQFGRLKAEREGRGGLVIATHDLDRFLPLADRVIIMRDGTLAGIRTPEELARSPQILEEAGIGVPDCLKLASMLLSTADGCLKPEKGIPLDAAGLADVWAKKLLQQASGGGGIPESSDRTGSVSISAEEASPLSEDPEGLPEGLEVAGRNRVHKLDPRAKWFFYLCFTFGMLVQPGWAVTAAGFVLVAWLSRQAGIPAVKWIKPLGPMGIFLVLSGIISGLELSLSLAPFSLAGTGFSWKPAADTLRHLAPLLPVIAGGILFASTTGPMSMKKGLEAPLKMIPGMGGPAEAVAFTASALFRFMKWIPAEIERFAILASVRGKQGGKPGKLRIRQLPSFFTPLLLSLMQHAEELSVAMEARGYGTTGAKRTDAAPLRWKRNDGTACWVGAVIAALLTAVGWLAR